MRTTYLYVPFLLLTACGFSLGTAEQGKDHNATFSYNACLFGCTVDQPMLAGTHESIGAIADSMPGVTIHSSAPAIIDVGDASRSCCSKGSTQTCRTVSTSDACNSDESSQLTFNVNAFAVGSADISLVDSSGNVFDVVTLSAENAFRLVLQCNDAFGSATLSSASSCATIWTATDAAGHSLRATTGVELTSSDPSIVQFSSFLGDNHPMMAGDQGLFGTEIQALTQGTATVTAQTQTQVTSTMTVNVTQ